MKYFLIAGEPSGDQHGSMLMQSIMAIDRDAKFRFLGGDLMEKAGGRAVIHIRDLAFMGFSQLASRLLIIRRNFSVCKKEIQSFRPDMVIPVDYGGFNLRLLPWLSRNGFKCAYYITPKVWAWMPARAKILARHATRSLCILPFEPEFLGKYGVPCEYVGNPVRDYIRSAGSADPLNTRSALGLNESPVIALLPGSRRQEISMMLPAMIGLPGHFPGFQFVIAGHPNIPEAFYHEFCGQSGISIVYDRTLELLRISAAAVVTSGTATLEAALVGTPQVVGYKTSPVSYRIARLLIRVRYISLVNLILGRSSVEELIQSDYTVENLARSLDRVLRDSACREQIRNDYRELEQLLGEQEASSTAAAIVCRMALEP